MRQAAGGALEKLSITLLTKPPLYPWHLPHLSIPLTTQIEFFFKDRMRPYSRVQPKKQGRLGQLAVSSLLQQRKLLKSGP